LTSSSKTWLHKDQTNEQGRRREEHAHPGLAVEMLNPYVSQGGANPCRETNRNCYQGARDINDPPTPQGPQEESNADSRGNNWGTYQWLGHWRKRGQFNNNIDDSKYRYLDANVNPDLTHQIKGLTETAKPGVH
jgi:hypothetical protein